MKLNLVKTSDFVFRTKLFRVYDMELPFVEHLEELRQRIFQMGVIFLTMILVVFINGIHKTAPFFEDKLY